MSINELKGDSPHDVAVQVRRLSQAVIGQIHRTRGAHTRAVLDMALGAWEGVATQDYIIELATRTMPGLNATDVTNRLHRDTLVHLNDFLSVARGDAKIIGDARALINSAIAIVTRHA